MQRLVCLTHGKWNTDAIASTTVLSYEGIADTLGLVGVTRTDLSRTAGQIRLLGYGMAP